MKYCTHTVGDGLLYHFIFLHIYFEIFEERKRMFKNSCHRFIYPCILYINHVFAMHLSCHVFSYVTFYVLMYMIYIPNIL
jgi:hypothetical protein